MRKLLWLGIVCWSGPSFAQALPEGARKTDAASGGKTEVVADQFDAAAKDDASKDGTSAEAAAGGLITSGNSKQMALTSSAKLKARRKNHQFSTQAAINFARAAPDADAESETTVENLQGRIRYDYFFVPKWAAFLGVSGRRDRFQGLDLRLNIDPGLAHYFVDEEKHALWLEGGYDLQYDIRRDENIAEAAAGGETVDKTEVRHSARGFVGYDNQVNERVHFATGLEYIQSVQDSKTWRLNWDGSITSNIAGRFSTSVVVQVKYDHDPLPGIKTTDVMTSFNLVYTLL
jgi:putative salt-induced outer membrane protein YdiY